MGLIGFVTLKTYSLSFVEEALDWQCSGYAMKLMSGCFFI
jgi:hypothetical protein